MECVGDCAMICGGEEALAEIRVGRLKNTLFLAGVLANGIAIKDKKLVLLEDETEWSDRFVSFIVEAEIVSTLNISEQQEWWRLRNRAAE